MNNFHEELGKALTKKELEVEKNNALYHACKCITQEDCERAMQIYYSLCDRETYSNRNLICREGRTSE